MQNPLLKPSARPYQWPAFDVLTADHYLEAAKLGAAEQRNELQRIIDDHGAPTFANTFLALESSGQVLRRAMMTYFSVLSAHGTEPIRSIQTEMSSIYSAQEDEIYLNQSLYSRLQALDCSQLTGEDARLAEQTLKEFKLAGADLDETQKQQLKQLNAQLSELSSQFSNRVLENQNAHAVHFDSAEELAGLSDQAIESAAQAAKQAGHSSGYLLPLFSPTQQPVLESLSDSEARRKVFSASVSRGIGENPTVQLAADMAKLRAERATLLGFANHAETVLAQATAPSTAAVEERLRELTKAATANAHKEAEVLGNIAGQEVNAWDWKYYSNQVLREQYAVDSEALRDYFELDRVLIDGVFATATKLYGITFVERFDLPTYHEQVRVFEVFDADGSPLALYTGDYLARETKKGGAWMTSLRDAASYFDERPIVTNTLNISAPAEGDPILLTLDETNTLFHEFGHALHGMFSNGQYASLSGTSVPRDFVEFPSQVNEMWVLDKQVLPGYAVHHQTGQSLDAQTISKIRAAGLWGQGFATTEYLAASVLDWAWHTISADTAIGDPVQFEQQVLEDAGFDTALIPPRYRTGYFQHIFANGYSAGYYSYIWSEVLDADTVQWFEENGGLMRENGNRFREELLSRGNTRDPLESYELFRGRTARVEPLLRRRGLVNAE
ncbi:M3 family metallopeptidase [Glutamicibacter mishrai]|uniref:M3 family peptidase n=1 Tax=Glutamicibacter mishrai TaxID=1775880 RepID=A0A6H0SGW1_9MICC|nr:M3 family metallopeptidase [Glutamicibacter mishrai]QIV85669.1 M3 family peptidase [Glutamicibacter mishrai]